MGTLDVLLAIDAATSGNAQRRATVRHRHLSPAPMTIVAYRMSGEAGAPLGVCYGTSEADPTFLVAAEPRNRTFRFRDMLNPLATALCSWLSNHQHRTPVLDREGHRTDQLTCTMTPQILVPNRATADFVGAVLGRSLRYLRSTDNYPVPAQTILLGTHMTWFEQQAQVPGSSVLLAATDLLRRHWATGQSALEDEDLHVLLDWINPPRGATGADTASATESRRVSGELPAVGPTPDPGWDSQVLEPLIEQFNQTRNRDESPEAVEAHGQPIVDAVTEALTPGWRATWAAHRLLGGLRGGQTVADRWEGDRKAWSYHVHRVDEDRAFFSTNDSAKLAASTLADFERAQDALDRGEAIDDPLVAAGMVAGGEAILGIVTGLDLDRKKPGSARSYRPQLQLRLDDPCILPVGRTLAWLDHTQPTAKERVKAHVEIVDVNGLEVTVEAFRNFGRGKPGPETFPAVGESILLAPVINSSFPPPRAPQEVPWTHIGAETPRYASEVAE
jgi:hypothetical protein